MLDAILGMTRGIYFRGKHRLLDPIVPRQGERETSLFGARVQLDLTDFIQRSAYMGTFEPHEVQVIRSMLAPGMRFVDVGANIGFFTALGISCVGPSGAVYSFEPSPWAFGRLERMVKENSWQNVQAYNLGLSDRPGTLKLFLGDEGNHTPTMVAHDQKVIAEVKVQTLDDVIAQNQIPQIQLLKVDVEGYEPNVLLGGANSFRAGWASSILAEFNEHWLERNQSSSDKLHNLLSDFGFKHTRSFGLNRIYKHQTQV